ncbi:hypothetical protein MKW92_039637 [Papaver armeniacum]|nr:hypothetical protein MKW92_039637 [Papaver armeniacum]
MELSSVYCSGRICRRKNCLHVDSNSFYGSHFSSLSLDDFTSFLHAQKTQPGTTLPHRQWKQRCRWGQRLCDH